MFIFFDIDGTLLDQRSAERAAADHFLAAYGHLMREDCDAPQFCRRWRNIRERHLPAYLRGRISYQEYRRRRIRDLFPDGNSLPENELDARFQLFHDGYRGAWQPYADVQPALEQLRQHFPLGILSNGNAAHQRWKLRRMGILDRFRVVVVSEEAGAEKPRQEIFAEACRRAGVPASRCVCVGDRVDHDVHPSQANGMRGIWLNRSDVAIHAAAPSESSEFRAAGEAPRSDAAPTPHGEARTPHGEARADGGGTHAVETIRSLAELPARLLASAELSASHADDAARGTSGPPQPRPSLGQELYSG